MKRIALLIFLFLTPALFAQALLDDDAECVSLIKQNLGYNSGSQVIKDTTAKMILKMAAIEVNNLVSAINIVDTMTMTMNKVAYSMNAGLVDDTIIEVKSVLIIDNVLNISKPLKYVPREWWDTLYYTGYTINSQPLTSVGRLPEYYDWQTNVLLINPTPVRTNYLVVVMGTGKIENIETSTTYMSQIPLNLRSPIIYLATAYCAVMRQDYAKANRWLNDFYLDANIANATASRGINVNNHTVMGQ